MTGSGFRSERRLVVGCPVYAREWIIERWLEHIRAAAVHAAVEADVLMLGPQSDLTFARGRQVARRLGLRLDEVDSGEEPAGTGRTEVGSWRTWSHGRLAHMVRLRNQLLDVVRRIAPRYFLSLDSDILLHESSISNMIETVSTSSFSAVGGKTYLTPSGDHAPSYALIDEAGFLVRQSMNAVRQVDILMAIKLMTPAAYSVDYEFDRRGEDVGWSLACARTGLLLGWDGRVTSEHVMVPA